MRGIFMQLNDKNYSQAELEDYKKFFDETPVALIRTDVKTGEFLMANNYAIHLFGFESFDGLKANCRTVDFYPPEDRKALIKILKKQSAVENYEIKMLLPHQTIWVSARLRINCGGTCIEGSLIDITEKVMIREKYLILLKDMGCKLDKIAALAS